MSVYRVPAIYDHVTRQIRPAGVADMIDPRFFNYNMHDTLFADQTNALRIVEGKLYYSSVSHDKGNYIKPGKDGAPFLDGNSILSNGGNGKPNLLSIDPIDGKIVLTLDIMKAYGVAVNTDVAAVFNDIKEYIDTAFVALADLPQKIAAYTTMYATTTELDTLRVRVRALEQLVESLGKDT